MRWFQLVRLRPGLCVRRLSSGFQGAKGKWRLGAGASLRSLIGRHTRRSPGGSNLYLQSPQKTDSLPVGSLGHVTGGIT